MQKRKGRAAMASTAKKDDEIKGGGYSREVEKGSGGSGRRCRSTASASGARNQQQLMFAASGTCHTYSGHFSPRNI